MKAKYLSKMPLYSSYSMFSNESNESLNVTEDKTAETTLASPTPALESPSSVKLNFRYVLYDLDFGFWTFTTGLFDSKWYLQFQITFSLKKSQSMVSTSSSSKTSSSTGSVIPRDKSLQSFTQALIHAEPPQENIYESVDNTDSSTQNLEMVELTNGKTKRSDSSYTFQSYEGSSRSSTLSSAICKPLMGTRVLPPRNRFLEVDSNPSSAYYR